MGLVARDRGRGVVPDELRDGGRAVRVADRHAREPGDVAARLDALRDELAKRKTKAFLVVRNDRIVYEWYAAGPRPRRRRTTPRRWPRRSSAGCRSAVAMTDGRIALDDPAAKYVPQWKDDPRKAKITVRHLGSHTSGLEDAEADGVPHDKLTGWKGDFWKRLPAAERPVHHRPGPDAAAVRAGRRSSSTATPASPC